MLSRKGGAKATTPEAVERFRRAISCAGGNQTVETATGVSTSAMGRFMKGHGMRWRSFCKLAEFCSVTPEWILGAAPSTLADVEHERSAPSSAFEPSKTIRIASVLTAIENEPVSRAEKIRLMSFFRKIIEQEESA